MGNNTLRKSMIVLLLSMATAGVLADELTSKAKILLDQGKAGEAYTLLEAQEGAQAGDPTFDLLLGVSAIEVGQNTRAVFALERVLAVQPNNARARAEIARAYLALGETTAAKQEFEAVQKQGVPPEVSAQIDRLLDAVDRIDSVNHTTIRGYLEGALGYDTNINAATSRSTVATPGFGGSIVLSKDGTAIAAGVAALGGGVSFRAPLNNDLAFVAGLSGLSRNNFGESQFDNLSADAYAGMVLVRDRNVFSLNAQINQYNLDRDGYRTATGLSGQWQFNQDAHNQLSAYVQYSDLHYPTQSIRDADRWVFGGALAHAYRTGTVVYGSLYWANERPQESAATTLAFDGPGLRAGGQMNLNASTELFANGSIEYRGYDGFDPAFLVTRKDTQYDLVMGANYVPARFWKVTPRLSWTMNDSNVEINQYHREAVSVTVRREF